MNTRFLRTFLAVAEAGSIAAAARQLGLATASAGEQLRALEREVGAPLLARRGRFLVLTAAGQAILPALREVLARLEELPQIARGREAAGPLRVGAISTALVGVLPAAMRLVAGRHPGVELKVTPGTAGHLYRLLEAGELDCVLVPRPPFALPKSLLWRPVREEPLVLLAPPTLAGAEVPALLRAAPLIRMDRASWTGRLITAFLEDHRLAPAELFEMDAPEAIVILVAQGMGVALLPDWGILPPAGQPLRRLPIPGVRYARGLGLLLARRAREGLALLLAETLAEAAAPPMPHIPSARR